MTATMRLATWNCRVGAFRRKAARIAPLRPDILVVPECEDLDSLLFVDGDPKPTFTHRAGLPQFTRGVGLFSYGTASVTPVELPRERLVFFDLYEVSTKGQAFRLGAVWTTATEDKARTYRQVHDALEPHRDLLAEGDVVLLGDFNNNASYGKPWGELLEAMEPFDLISAYHTFFAEDFGKETRPTYFHRAKEKSQFHVDYCFLPRSWASRIARVTVGAHEDWCDVSDHVPLVVDLSIS